MLAQLSRLNKIVADPIFAQFWEATFFVIEEAAQLMLK
jgi:hypothetical protein